MAGEDEHRDHYTAEFTPDTDVFPHAALLPILLTTHRPFISSSATVFRFVRTHESTVMRIVEHIPNYFSQMDRSIRKRKKKKKKNDALDRVASTYTAVDPSIV